MNYEILKKKREKYESLLESSINKVLEKLADKVEKIILIGSYPKRKDLFTDLDIVVIMNTEKPFLERLKELYSFLQLPVDVDIFCYTPEEYEKIKDKIAIEKGLILYEKKSN